MVDRKTEVIILTSVLGLLAIVAVVLRFIARRVKRSSLGTDDYTILAALVLSPLFRVYTLLNCVSLLRSEYVHRL